MPYKAEYDFDFRCKVVRKVVDEDQSHKSTGKEFGVSTPTVSAWVRLSRKQHEVTGFWPWEWKELAEKAVERESGEAIYDNPELVAKIKAGMEAGREIRTLDTVGYNRRFDWVVERQKLADEWLELAKIACEAAKITGRTALKGTAWTEIEAQIVQGVKALGGNTPWKSFLSGAAIALDKAILLNSNEPTDRTAQSITQRITGTVATPDMANLAAILEARGPVVSDPALSDMFGEMEAYLLGVKDAEAKEDSKVEM